MKNVSENELVTLLTQHGAIPPGEMLAIERDDKTVGYYLPVAAPRRAEFRLAMAQLEKTITRVMADTGLTEADLFDLTKPLPETHDAPHATVHAPRR